MTRIRSFLIAGLVAFVILAVGQALWAGLLLTNLSTTASIPWSVPAMALALWAIWRFLSATPERRRLLRANSVSAFTYLPSLLVGAFAAFSLAGLWIVLFELVKMPPNLLPAVSGRPIWTAVAIALMGSLVSPLIEEAAFRGYCQSILERDFSPAVAAIITTGFFAVAHLTQGLYWPKLLVYFLFGLCCGILALLNRSILPVIPAHAIADLTFFTLVWPHDAARRLVWQAGPSHWFWIHVVQFMVFGGVTVFMLARIAAGRPSCHIGVWLPRAWRTR